MRYRLRQSLWRWTERVSGFFPEIEIEIETDRGMDNRMIDRLRRERMRVREREKMREGEKGLEGRWRLPSPSPSFLFLSLPLAPPPLSLFHFCRIVDPQSWPALDQLRGQILGCRARAAAAAAAAGVANW
jgi:hypothetical protein